MQTKTVFERTEKKYLITTTLRDILLEKIADKMLPDLYGKSTICSLYFDTDDFRLIRNSIEKPIYKEKLRLRSYSVPDEYSEVFLELKKKYKGVVYKRRKTMDYISAKEYIYNHKMPDNSQIMKEIDWTMNFYRDLKPKMFIAYDRCAYFGKDDENLRITFDMDLRYRTDNLSLSAGSDGEKVIDESLCIMEIKALKAMPMWLCDMLNELKIYPSSFSKYGTAYRIISQKNGGYNCA